MAKRRKKPAAKRSSAKTAAPKTEAVKPSEVMKMPPAGTVKSLATEIRQAKDHSKRITDAVAERIADAKKEKGVHPGALKRAEALLNKAKKTDRGLNAVAAELAHFQFYCDTLGLYDMLEKQGVMFDQRPPATFGTALRQAQPDIDGDKPAADDQAKAGRDHVAGLAQKAGAELPGNGTGKLN